MKLFNKAIGFATVLFFTGILSVACQSSNTAIEESINQVFSDFDDINKPGAAVAVAKDGEIIFKKGYGSANLEYDIPVTSSTIFHVASVSKQFTVFALLLLAEEGKLSLDDPIQKYLPEVTDFGEKITLRHLATHTSGMRDQWELLSLAGWRWDDVITKEHILKLVAKQRELNFRPGDEYTYCNTGFTLLAEVVARVSGKSFAEFTKERMFIPLKMTNSQFYDDHTKIVKNRAYSYNVTDSGISKSVLSYANVGATSLFTTVEDLSLWAMNFKDLKVGSASIVEQMNTLAILNNGETFGGAYGQFVTPYRGLRQIQHSGGDAGFRSHLTRFPDQNFSVAVVSNSGSSNPVSLAMQVVDLFLKDQFVEEETKELDEVKTITMSEGQLRAFEGSFWDSKDKFSRKIHVQDGTLIYDRGNGNTTELGPISKNKFKMLDVPGLVVVEFMKKDGKDHMTVTQDGEVVARMEQYIADDPKTIDLKEYEGNYSSDELSTTYTLVEKDGKLIATHPRRSDLPLTFSKKDFFNASGSSIEFVRENNAVNGFMVSTGRVRNLTFKRD